MIFTRAGVKKFIIPASALGMLLVLGLMFLYSRNPVISANGDSQLVTGGFEPGTKISYNILVPGSRSVSGDILADQKGQAVLPPLNLKAAGQKDFVYRLEVENPDSSVPMQMSLHFDSDKEKISATGSGLDEFSEVVLVRSDAASAVKTDWAGLLHEMELFDLADLEKERRVRIAFQGFNMANDAHSMRPSPYIEIQHLDPQPGVGGQLVDPQPAPWTPTGPTNLSTYNIAAVNATIPPMVSYFVTAMHMMTEQFSAIMMQQVEIIGTFLDAKLQLETQEKLRQLQAEAQKDYHPSDGMCRIGSYIKSVARTEEKAGQNKQALSRILRERQLNVANTSSMEGYDLDVESRLQQFKTIYCDPQDNNNGLASMCDHDGNLTGGAVGAASPRRMNIDIDYPRLVDNPLTLQVDFTNASGAGLEGETEEDLIALAKNLYWPRALTLADSRKVVQNYQVYLDARRLIAAQGVAMNSFVNLIGAKSKSAAGVGANSGWAYMKAMMREFGLSPGDINEILGENPSYYAQMDVLTKKMFQHPNFFTNLYDKPANVERIGASLRAVELMHERDRFESSLRREMLISQLVEDALRKHQEDINVRLFSGLKENR